jgi:hypothetical protein
MASDSERLEILKLVETKQISPEEGARLLDALDEEAPPARAAYAGSPVSRAGRWLKLRVEDLGGQRVNLSLPLSVMPVLLRVVGPWVPDRHRMLFQTASDRVANGFRGDLLHVEEPGGHRVHLWVE